eukprot:COSAG01_NODE_59169_length_301_cov_15.549505_1_plen_73_part_01
MMVAVTGLQNLWWVPLEAPCGYPPTAIIIPLHPPQFVLGQVFAPMAGAALQQPHHLRVHHGQGWADTGLIRMF